MLGSFHYAPPKMRINLMADRKSATNALAQRSHRRAQRDVKQLEYLRGVRDFRCAQLRKERSDFSMLSVYGDPSLFPLKAQIKTRRKRSFISGERKYVRTIIIDGNRNPLPKWNDLTDLMKLELFHIIGEKTEFKIFTFNPKIDPRIIKRYRGKYLINYIRRRLTIEFSRLTPPLTAYAFVIETHSKAGTRVSPHLHGSCLVDPKTTLKDVSNATSRAAGQGLRGDRMLPSGNSVQPYFLFSHHRTWARYMLKKADLSKSEFGRRSLVMSRHCTQLSAAFWDMLSCT